MPCSRLNEAALPTFNHEALARRHAAIGHADLVEYLKIGLPAVRRHDMADIAALTVEELNVRVLLRAGNRLDTCTSREVSEA